ncbi:hypothetical protein HYDPIDRAFT_31898 [Hydnomerulius pinastri MD-312]|uniref:Uncharacterized protein n=1 Tax=Hydnomerulius pinastri MD-312 TaxID=994086 RepID=A0A0C9WB19_9AGAM|nr:hypothetical protein HYDPIDRAFT_31898 [Hydnomerulius pinastri MD-312]
MSSQSMAEPDAAVTRKLAISACLSLMVMLVDYGWLLRDELKIIWPKLWSSRYAKVYVFSRYLGTASQIFNVFFSLRMLAGVSAAPSTCKMWYNYQAIVVQVLLATVEGTLMHRIYALFLGNKWILSFLILFGIGQIASMAVSARVALPSIRYTETCLVVATHPGSIYFG